MKLSVTALTITAAAALLLSGCSPNSATGNQPKADESAPQSASEGFGSQCDVVPDGSFPVEIHHAFGSTVIEQKPERVATVAWGNHEVPLALGVIPVGMTAVTWGDDDDNGIMPWVEDQLNSLNADDPVLFDETDGIDFEKVAGTSPDVILASYSGLSQEDYDTLSKIAPVVAYPEIPWATSVWEMICMNSKALGKSTSGAELSESLKTQVEEALAENPELADKKLLFTFLDSTDLSTIGYYTLHDTRPSFLAGFGLPQPDLVAESTDSSAEFYKSISSEQAGSLEDVDVVVTYGQSKREVLAMLQEDPLLSNIPAVRAGNVVVLEENTPLAASANPSPLSIPWGIHDYFAALNGKGKNE